VEEEDEFMIGQIIDYAGTQDTWDDSKMMECNGRLLSTVDYPELYQVIGREWTYDESTPADRFNIPDLRGRLTIGFDAGSNAEPRQSNTDELKLEQNYGSIGNWGGKDAIQLSAFSLPDHTHLMFANTDAQGSQTDKPSPTSSVSVERNSGGNHQYRAGKTNEAATLGLTDVSGAGLAHENRQPYRVVYKLIRYK
jgi:microcystin-dependent protein